jgi:hypothetical protein
MARVAVADLMTVLQNPLYALDRADLPRAVKESLRLSIIAIAEAYAEDDDAQKVAPDANSFARLVKFLEHPHRWSWAPPAISVSPEGYFSAIWDEPGAHRWILDFTPDGEITETYLQTHPDGRIEHKFGKVQASDHVYPPFAIS